jgi:hypothetical protein
MKRTPGNSGPIFSLAAFVVLLGGVVSSQEAKNPSAAALPGAAAVSGRGRVDVRFAEDSAGELYLLTKSDGMIRQVVGVR